MTTLPVDIVLAVLLVEAGVLLARRVALADVLAALLPGAAMLLALRAVLSGQGTGAAMIWLAVSGLIHAWDLYRRGWLKKPRR
ncbi:hypothetical protein [Sandaracinobacteroides saxicola]|uniref:DUF2484 family protein n=1 Tax=Sandaracinobacteroides saxicola TaxID=2759707 RepID=A0A7G5IKU6_9SPHN|nr:hypothetical protein [Sandaracinobacteroides saxicola]QMW23988.1 hypothetical protein H3309_05845 [Sandaracinobacteroides saxicola]